MANVKQSLSVILSAVSAMLCGAFLWPYLSRDWVQEDRGPDPVFLLALLGCIIGGAILIGHVMEFRRRRAQFWSAERIASIILLIPSALVVASMVVAIFIGIFIGIFRH